MNVLANPRTERQQRTRNLIGAVASYGAGALARSLVGKGEKISRPMPSVAQVIRMSHEPKNADYQAFPSTSATGYNVTLLNGIVQGTSGTTRTGRQVMLEQLRVQLIFFPSQTASGDVVRVILVRDRETRGATPGLGDVLNVNTYGLTSVASSYNFDNVPSRFTILSDTVVALHPTIYVTSAALPNAVYVPLLIEKKLGTKTHYYNTTVGNVTDVDSGGIFMFILNVAAAFQTQYQVDSRVVFRDI